MAQILLMLGAILLTIPGAAMRLLGYHISPDRLSVAKKTLENVVTRIRRLDE